MVGFISFKTIFDTCVLGVPAGPHAKSGLSRAFFDWMSKFTCAEKSKLVQYTKITYCSYIWRMLIEFKIKRPKRKDNFIT